LSLTGTPPLQPEMPRILRLNCDRRRSSNLRA
jgi:hypothetical protein